MKKNVSCVEIHRKKVVLFADEKLVLRVSGKSYQLPAPLLNKVLK